MAWAEEQSWFGLEPEDVEFDWEVYIRYHIDLLNKGCWECKDHSIIKIKDMSDVHLRNSVKKIERENWRTFALPYLKKEIKRRNLKKQIYVS